MEPIRNQSNNLINNKIMVVKYSNMQIHKLINQYQELADRSIRICQPHQDQIEMGLCLSVFKETTNFKTNLKIAETI